MIMNACLCCGKSLHTWLEDSWGNRYCLEHEAAYPVCPYCHRLIGGANRAAPARTGPACAACARTAVTAGERAAVCWQRALAWAAAQGLALDRQAIRFGLCTQADLRAWTQGADSRHYGMTCSRIYQRPDGAVTCNTEVTVAIVEGLPETLFGGIAVHELGHAWLRLQNICQLSVPDEEGFCEVLAFRYYDSLRSREGAFYADTISGNTHPVYGAGFRKMRALTDKYGLLPLLTHVRRLKGFPP